MPPRLSSSSLSAAESGSDSDPEVKDFSDNEISDVSGASESEYFSDAGEDETASLGFLDPHLEKNFKSIRQSASSSIWIDLPCADHITKVSGMSAEEAQAAQSHLPKLKPKLLEAWKKSVEAESDDLDDLYLPFQQEIIGPLALYQDVALMNVTGETEDEYRRLILLHAMNHVMKIRDRILHHNQSIGKDGPTDDDDIMRDQGFTRPRILILCPMRNIAHDLIQMIMELWTLTGASVEGRGRFEKEFGEPRDEDGDVLEGSGPDPTKPDDHNRTFRGNVDDCFRVGLKFTRKSMKIFSDFYSSDIIIASPLGLRLVIDGQKEGKPRKNAGGAGKKRPAAKKARQADGDFLSSINICMIDRADIMHMQNWEHLEYCLKHVNALPTDPHGCDFSRVQTAYLDGLSRKIRQTITLSTFPFPELNGLLSNPQLVDSSLGRWRLENTHSSAIIKRAKPFIDVKFHRFATKSLAEQPEDRLTYFTQKILPAYAKLDHVCIFVSSYFDFCQLKQWFSTRPHLSFACLGEYEEGGAITGARAKFFNGHAKYLLITERFHFYRRLRIRGVKHLLWYSLPDHSEYFSECAEWVGDVHKRNKDDQEEVVTKRDPKTESPILYCQFDALKLQRIVGDQMIDKLF